MDSEQRVVLAHLSDLHLGYRSGRKTNAHGVNWREQDGYVAFKHVVDEILADGTIDFVLIAGDVFHVPTPSVRTVCVAQKQVRRLADAGIPVYILTGNHDVSDVRTEMAATAMLNDPEHGVHAHWEPYAVHEAAPDLKLHLISHHLYQEQADTWEKIQPDPGCVNILSTHGSVIDPLTKLALHTEASPREVIIPDEIADNPGWTYKLLGHIHERGFVGSKNGKTDTAGLKTYYNGSIMRRGFSDAETPLGRGWTKWTVEPDGTMSPEFHLVPQRPQVDFPVIDAANMSAADLTSAIVDELDETLKGTPEGKWNAAPILRQKILNMTPDKRRAIDHAAISKAAEKALQWSMTATNAEEEKDDAKQEKIGQTTGTVTEQFDGWIKSSKDYQAIHEGIREKVAEETRRFIKQGQDAVLDKAGDEED